MLFLFIARYKLTGSKKKRRKKERGKPKSIIRVSPLLTIQIKTEMYNVNIHTNKHSFTVTFIKMYTHETGFIYTPCSTSSVSHVCIKGIV